MKIFGDLKFIGHDLNKIFSDLENYDRNDWKRLPKTDGWEQYIRFEYVGTRLNKAILYIYYLGNTNEVHVGNIIPRNKDTLIIEEYNELLIDFYNAVISPIEKNYENLEIILNKGEFNPLEIMSENALDKLKLFCNNANKSTGSSHPSDQVLWFDFIIQTVKDGRIIDYDILKLFLMDTEYWDKKNKDTKGVIGKFAWDEEKAEELAIEYDNYSTFLDYYIKNRKGEN